MQSEYRMYVRYFNYVSADLFNEYAPTRNSHRAIVAHMAWALEIIPEIDCPECGARMTNMSGSMAFICAECGQVISDQHDIVMRWHQQHWKEVGPPEDTLCTSCEGMGRHYNDDTPPFHKICAQCKGTGWKDQKR